MSYAAPSSEPNRPALAFVAGAVVGALGGLIGLGGAEFRLPLLIGLFGLVAHQAVRVNLLVSLATVTAAAVARFGLGGTTGVADLLPEIAALTAGAVAAAWVGAGLLARLSAAVLARLIAGLLGVVAAILLADAALGLAAGAGVPAEGGLRLLVGLVAGLGIGAISSLLGIAGGEFLILTFMLAFGADIRTAGTASLLVSLPTVAVGVARFARQGAYRHGPTISRLVLPMALGSVLGATAGAALLPYAPAGALKAALGGSSPSRRSSWRGRTDALGLRGEGAHHAGDGGPHHTGDPGERRRGGAGPVPVAEQPEPRLRGHLPSPTSAFVRAIPANQAGLPAVQPRPGRTVPPSAAVGAAGHPSAAVTHLSNPQRPGGAS